MKLLATENLRLEPLSLSHTQALYDLTVKNREYLKEWLPWLDNISRVGDTKRFISVIIQPESPPQFVILDKEQVCGCAPTPSFDDAQPALQSSYLLQFDAIT